MSMRWVCCLGVVAGLMAVTAGCGPKFTPRARNGITFYCPGAGNIDNGDAGIRQGLDAAGYRGQVMSVIWTVSLNPAFDQVFRINARAGAKRLARAIEEYIDRYPQSRYPDRRVVVIGLSAGTGVAIWACEELQDDPKYRVDDVVLLSGSLSHDYDVSKALRKVRGKIYNLYSDKDLVLAGPMKAVGTIDGKLLTDGVGAVGLVPPRGPDANRVVNIPWTREYTRYGYYGGHTDVTSAAFVRAKLAPLIMAIEAGPRDQHATAASREEPAPQDEHLN